MLSEIIKHPEAVRMFVSTIVYPLVGLYVALRLAKFHFEKDIKKQYLLAKDKVANS